MLFHKHKGFTLVELLVVIVIISILTGIITANLAQSKSKARDGKRISDLAQLQLSLELFFDRCNRYPAALQTDASTNCPSNINLGTFISKIPTPPVANESYQYGVNANGTDYVLKATLERNNSALVDVNRVNHPSPISVDCTPALAYCVQPR